MLSLRNLLLWHFRLSIIYISFTMAYYCMDWLLVVGIIVKVTNKEEEMPIAWWDCDLFWFWGQMSSSDWNLNFVSFPRHSWITHLTNNDSLRTCCSKRDEDLWVKRSRWNKMIMPPFEKGGHIALHLSVGMSVALNLVQLITQERFAPEASNLVGR